MDFIPIILAGGSGTRLWPLSRRTCPKPFLSLKGGLTLLQETLGRLGGDDRIRAPMVVCNQAHRFLVVEQCSEVHCHPALILLEPEGRDTAPSLTAAALAARADAVEDPVLVVMPADHVFRDPEGFRAAVAEALPAAADGWLMTFGIVPDRPETGYGYIRAAAPLTGAACEVMQFVEKPDAATAERYLASGEYFWNSGIFAVRASRWLEAMQRHAPGMLDACRSAWERGKRDGNFFQLDAPAFTAIPGESIDYAVMEKADRIGMVALDAGWSDVGSWTSLREVYAADDNGNILHGDVIAHGSRDCIVSAHSRLVTAVGLSDMIVAETGDAVLVAHKDHAQDVKQIVDQLDSGGREEGWQHRRVRRPWGAYEPVDAGERFQVKRLTVFPGAALSLQMHHHRAEHWVVVRGRAAITRDGEQFELGPNESTYIPIGTVHRLANPGAEPLEVIEVQSGDYLGEDDIVRFEDVYGRAQAG